VSTGYGAVGPRTRQALLALSPAAPKEYTKEKVAASAETPTATERVEVERLQERIAELTSELGTLRERLAGRQRTFLIE